ncbi:GMP synthase [Reticulibacter mediterranei]|uniref:GMP synthase n=1 Tax=Reticulibacter mediterranei TaxID=2778369 RepID=A0A8J3N0G5_9CHLR|nr:type 1 glutamine amidotransferase [Reticulibacter mediterranei]GHO91225.1 GMP synthase [Reticulibacter mediterranei]
MKRILLLEHEKDNPEGYIGTLLEEHQIATDVIRVDQERLPAPDHYSAIIAFGGAQHLYEAENYPYFGPEKALLRASIEREQPVLGICLGAQLVASALGGIVKRHHTSELGFYDIPLNEEGKKDPLYQGLPGYQKVIHWHEDTFDLPAEAILLASNEITTNQAFRYGKRTYGLQYHIELDTPMLDNWLYHCGLQRDIMDKLGVEAYHTFSEQLLVQFTIYQRHTRIVLENFLRISELI